MNNTKANGLQKAHYLQNANSGHTGAISIRKQAAYILEGPLGSDYSKETTIKNQNISPQNHE